MSPKDTGRHSTRGRKPKARQARIGSGKRKLLVGLGVVIAVVLIVVIATIPEKPKTYLALPPMTIDTSKQYTATIPIPLSTTSMGTTRYLVS